jgi:chloride channel protein, CIC family
VNVIANSNRNIFPVVDQQGYFLGIVTLDNVREIMFDRSKYDSLKVQNLMFYPKATVTPQESMDQVMAKFRESGLWNMAVLENGLYKGYVSRSNVFNFYRSKLREFTEDEEN